jgi:hypothetical protein
MAQKTRSKMALQESENVPTLTDKGPEVEKRGHSTDTEDPPRKKARNQHDVDGVSGNNVLYFITLKHSLADHDI